MLHASVWSVEIDETFRANLRALRESRGLNADQLSKLAGINRRGVRDIEEGRSQSPKLSTVAAIADALGVELGDLLGLGPRQTLNAELVEFLEQYDEDGQARLLAALAALPLPRA
jgi:transcriptional regulator with XRE-family HTH domain